MTAYGERDGNRRYGLIAAIALHLLLVGIWLIQPKIKPQHAAAKAGEAIVWLPPLPNKPSPKPKAQPAQKAAKPAASSRPTPPRVTQVQRLPNTITLPKEKPVEETPPPPPKEVAKAEPEATDMQAYIDAKRKARGAPSQSEQATEESQSAKGMRNALANIGAINGRNGQAATEALVGVSNKTFHSADIRFNVWNPNFKRRWLSVVSVERNNEPDIETAVINKMIEIIRKEASDEVEWNTNAGRKVRLSVKPEDTQALKEFLFKEIFPEYKAPRRAG